MKNYKVEMKVTCYVTVKAKNQEEAKQKAREIATSADTYNMYFPTGAPCAISSVYKS